MFDGSRLPLAPNIAETRAIVQIAHAAGVSCEGEIGFVGYASGAESIGTDPLEAARFAAETGVDAMAVSVGNVHLQQDQTGGLDLPRLAAIRAACAVPLVIHGGSGVPLAQRRELALTGQVAKFNIGTELRMTFGAALRQAITADPTRFDRIALLSETHAPLMQATRAILQNLNASGQA
jgi:fructose-bisphosphate aldolase, class II